MNQAGHGVKADTIWKVLTLYVNRNDEGENNSSNRRQGETTIFLIERYRFVLERFIWLVVEAGRTFIH